jgi:uncharacterized protein (DUF924 family)
MTPPIESAHLPGSAEVLHFWFEEAGREQWFKRSDAFDAQCRERFLPTLEAAARGECAHWRETPAGRCAEIIVLDQLSRNIFRGTPGAFTQDAMALTLAQWAVSCGDNHRMDVDQRYFCYMPFMHSESAAIHQEALRLFEALGNSEALRYEQAHREVILRFGRYPGRNEALGRASTADEVRYLEESGGF